MTLTKRDLVIRISEETGLIQQQVLTVVQKTLDYIARRTEIDYATYARYRGKLQMK